MEKNSINIGTVIQQVAFDCMPLYIKNYYIRLKQNKKYSKKLLISVSMAFAVNINNLIQEINENIEQLTLSDVRGNYKKFTEIMENFTLYHQRYGRR